MPCTSRHFPFALALLLSAGAAQADPPVDIPTSSAPATGAPKKPIVVPLPESERTPQRVWPKPDAAAALATGDAAFANRNYRAAIRSYQDAVLADRRSVEALVKLGNAEAHLGYDSDAIDQYLRALTLDPRNTEALQALKESRARMALRGQPAAATTPAPPAPPAAPAPIPAAMVAPVIVPIGAPDAGPATQPR